jgi:hypothetical protein
MREAVRTVTAMIVNGLAEGAFEVLGNMTHGNNFSAADLQAIVEAYSGKLIRPPLLAFSNLDATEVAGASPPTFDVTFPLWTREKSVTPLVLKLRLIEHRPTLLDARILDLSLAFPRAT